MKSLMHQGRFSSLKTKAEAYMDAQRRAEYTLFAAMTTVAASTVPTLCSQGTGNAAMKDIFMSFLDIIYTMALFCGIALLAFAGFKLFVAIQEDNPEGQLRAVKQLIAAIALCCLKPFLAPLITKLLQNL